MVDIPGGGGDPGNRAALYGPFGSGFHHQHGGEILQASASPASPMSPDDAESSQSEVPTQSFPSDHNAAAAEIPCVENAGSLGASVHLPLEEEEPLVEP